MIQDQEQWDRERAELDAWNDAPLTDLIILLMERYHRETRHGMAELENLAEEAALMDGHIYPILHTVRDEVDLFCSEMRAHLKMEEVTLFPAILAKEQGREYEEQYEILDPLDLFEEEHDAAAGLLMRIRTLTEGFNAPQDSRILQKSLYAACKTLAESLVRHIYLENQILFKRLA